MYSCIALRMSEVRAENTMPTALAKRVFGETSFGKWIPFLRAVRLPARQAKHGQTWPNMAKHGQTPMNRVCIFQMQKVSKVSQGSCFQVEFYGVLGLQLHSLYAGLCPQPPATVGNSPQPSAPSTHHGESSCFLVPWESRHLRRVFCKSALQEYCMYCASVTKRDQA